MKIAMLYANWEQFGEPWSTPKGIVNEFMNRRHEVRVYNLYHADGQLNPRTKIRQYSNEGLNRLHADMSNACFKPDVVLVMDYGPWQTPLLNPTTFPGAILIKEAGDEPQSHRMHCQSAQYFHGVLSPDYQCVERYHEMGIRARWWTHHADTSIFYPRTLIKPAWDCVTTCGPRGNGLTDKIKKALGDRFNNERYFYGIDHGERLCMGNIVFQCSQFKEITRRIFEGMACGKMVLTDRLPAGTHIDDIFTEDEHIVYYDSADEAIDKIRYYSEHPDERDKIASAGMMETLNHHTVSSRVDAIEDLVEDIKKAEVMRGDGR